MHQQPRSLNIQPLVINCLHIAQLIQQKRKLDYYRGKDCTKTFCKDLKEYATKIINYEKKKKMITLTNEEKNIYREHKDLVSAMTIKSTIK